MVFRLLPRTLARECAIIQPFPRPTPPGGAGSHRSGQGYEFCEYRENEFERLTLKCSATHGEALDDIEVVTTPGVLAPSIYELLYAIETQRMTMSYGSAISIGTSRAAVNPQTIRASQLKLAIDSRSM